MVECSYLPVCRNCGHRIIAFVFLWMCSCFQLTFLHSYDVNFVGMVIPGDDWSQAPPHQHVWWQHCSWHRDDLVWVWICTTAPCCPCCLRTCWHPFARCLWFFYCWSGSYHFILYTQGKCLHRHLFPAKRIKDIDMVWQPILCYWPSYVNSCHILFHCCPRTMF